jgi:hypothetical protein
MSSKRRARVPGMVAPQAARSWTPLELAESGPTGELFRNGIYQVRRQKLDPTGTVAARADDLNDGLWLIVSRTDGKAIHDWRHFQRIKNEVAGPEREALEIYPAESRLIDRGNTYHLWVLPAGERVPFGAGRRSVLGPEQQRGVAQRPFEP